MGGEGSSVSCPHLYVYLYVTPGEVSQLKSVTINKSVLVDIISPTHKCFSSSIFFIGIGNQYQYLIVIKLQMSSLLILIII